MTHVISGTVCLAYLIYPVTLDAHCLNTKYAVCVFRIAHKSVSVYRSFGASLHANRKNCVASQHYISVFFFLYNVVCFMCIYGPQLSEINK